MEIHTTLKWHYVLLLAVLSAHGTVHGVPTEPDAQSILVQDLFQYYINDLIPSCRNVSSKVTVSMDLSIRGVLDVDAPSQVITTYVWQRWSWQDCRLTWDPAEYNGIDRILVTSERLWIPDITVYDSVGGAQIEETVRFYRAIVQSDGEVFLMFPIIIQSTCKLDVKYFPYDRQVCKMKFASWTYTGSEIDLTNKSSEGDTSVFVDNGEWNLVAIPCRRLVLKYPCCENPFPELTYYLVLQREHLYYQFNLILPCILITAIALLVFCLPPESGEKMSLGITVLLSLTVFLLMVADRMPATSETIPLIGQYVGATIIIVSLSCCMTVLTLNVHHRGKDGRPVPKWLFKLAVRGLGTILCTNSKPPPPKNWGNSSSNKFQHNHIDGDRDLAHPRPSPALDGLSELQAAIISQQRDAQLATDWRLVALALDRLFLMLTFAATVVITAVVLHERPDLHNEADISEYIEGIMGDDPRRF